MTPLELKSFKYASVSLKCDNTIGYTPCYNNNHTWAINPFETLASLSSSSFLDTLSEGEIFKPLNLSHIVCYPNYDSNCIPNSTHCCFDKILNADTNDTSKCVSWKLKQPLQRVLAKFLPPPARGEDQGNNLGPPKDCLSSLPHILLNKYNSTNVTVIEAALGLVWLCGTPNNWLTDHSELQEAIAYAHLSNFKHGDDCNLGTLASQDLTIINITQGPGSPSLSRKKKMSILV